MGKSCWRQRSETYLFLPLAALLAAFPFLVRLTRQYLYGDLAQLYETRQKTEMFSQVRARVLWIAAVILLLVAVFFWKRIFAGLSKRMLFYLSAAGIFLLFVVLSAVFSAHRDTALWGMYDRAEGMVTIACYVLLFLFTALFYRDSKDLKWIAAALVVTVLVNGFFGTFQFFGHDLFSTDFMNAWIVPGDVESKILINKPGEIYGMLNHYNYMGSLAVMLLPVFLGLAFLGERRIWRMGALACAAISGWLLLGSSSRAGLVGILAVCAAAVVLLYRQILAHWKACLSVFVGFFLVVFAANGFLDNAILDRIPTLAKDIAVLFSDTSDFDYKDHIPVRDVQNTENGVAITTQQDVLSIKMEGGVPAFFRQDKTAVGFHQNEDEIWVTDDPLFAAFYFVPHTGIRENKTFTYFSLGYGYKEILDFYYDDHLIYLAEFGSPDRLDLKEPAVFKPLVGKELLGSMRGYIWSRSIPMLKEYSIFGAGADNFVYEFPQYDYLGKMYAYDNHASILVDKPHNLFLKIYIENGLIAFLTFLGITGGYLWESFRLYGWKKKIPRSGYGGLAVSLAVFGYLAAGFFNDTVISTSVVFWVLLGLGVGMNRQYRKESVAS